MADKVCLGCFSKYDEKFTVCPHCGYVEGTPVEEPLHMTPGTVLHQRYTIGKVLGFGGFGVTYIGWDTVLSIPVAIKEYLPSEFSTRMAGRTEVSVYSGNKADQFEQGLNRFVDEAKQLAKFQKEAGIVKVYDSFLENQTAYIIMEYLDGVTLTAYLEEHGIMPMEQAVTLLLPVMQSLQQVHQGKIVHRDIAPDNIMITKDGTAKLIDFGAARYATTSHSRSLTVIIKEGYSPEEQYRSRGEQGPYTDVYAIAATLYKIVTGITPPDALERRVLCENKKRDPLRDISDFDIPALENQQIALMNALNVRIEDRTPDMATLIQELTSETPVVRRTGKIKSIDFMKWPLWVKIVLPSVTACAVALGFLGNAMRVQYSTADIPAEMVRVPSVMNGGLESGAEKLKNAVLLPRVVGAQASSLIPENIIMQQDKDSGSYVLENTVVGMEISTGLENNIVPNVIGMYEEDATYQLEEAGYEINREEAFSNVIAAGAVIRQDIAPGSTYDRGGMVCLTISSGTDPEKKIAEELVSMPKLEKNSFDDALAAAEKAGFQIAVTSREFDEKSPADSVMYQSLSPGQKYMNHNTVELMVSQGIQTIRVENLFCQKEQDARDVILNQGLLVGDIVYVASELYETGLVIDQLPEPGTESTLGQEVVLTVSTGCEAFVMPDLSGMTLEQARTEALQLGLSVTYGYVREGDGTPGTVLTQSIAAEEAAMPGDMIVLTLLAGEEDEIADVPDVVGMEKKDAVKKLRKQDLKSAVTEAYSEDVPKGCVISQIPPADMSVLSSGVVTLTISMGSPRVSVPDLTGRSQSAAEEALKEAGLGVEVETVYSDTVTNGMVISQEPASEEMLVKGENVHIVVSKGREPIEIPDLVGMNKDDAIAALKEKKLSYTLKMSYSDKIAKNCVVEQSVAAGESGFSGDRITLTISLGKASVMPEKVTLNAASREMAEGDSFQLAATIAPENASDKEVKWSSDHPDVVTVSENGLVQAMKEGTAVITATTNSGGKTATCKITVKQASVSSIEISSYPTKMSYMTGDKLDTSGLRLIVTYSSRKTEVIDGGYQTSYDFSSSGRKNVRISYEGKSTSFDVTVIGVEISLNASQLTLEKGSTYGLAVNSSVNGNVRLTSSNDSVASVSAGGVIAAHKAGTAVITATLTFEGKSASAKCQVTVADHIVPSVSISGGNSLYIGDTLTLSASVVPAGQGVSWSSSNTAVASVNQNGTVTANGAGTAEIRGTITYDGKRYESSKRITVLAPEFSSNVSNNYQMLAGEAISLPQSVSPSGATVEWISSSSRIVSVENHSAQANNAGSATLTARISYRGKTVTSAYSIGITVSNPTVQIDYCPTELFVGETGNLLASAAGVTGNYTIEFRSSSNSILSVNTTDAGRGIGTCQANNFSNSPVTVTAVLKLNGREYTATKNIVIKQPSISIGGAPSALTIGESGTLTAILTPGGNETITWSSNHSEVIRVFSDGSYEAVGAGVAVVTASFTRFGVTYDAEVTITVG